MIDTRKGAELEQQNIRAALLIDEAAPENREAALSEAYKTAQTLLCWYRDSFTEMANLFSTALDKMQ